MDALTADEVVAWRLDHAREEIRQLAFRYAHGIDRRDMEMVADCYHPGAIDNHGGGYNGDAEGFVTWVEGILENFTMTMHFMGNSLIEIDGDTAESETYAVCYHRRPPEDGAEPEMVIGVRYLDRLAFRQGRWKIEHREVVVDWRRSDLVVPAPYVPLVRPGGASLPATGS